MNENTFELTFNSELIHVKNAIDQIIHFLNRHCPDISSEDLFDLRLIISELLCNAIIHGNKLDKTKQAYIKITITGNNIHVRISDQGTGFNYIASENCDQTSENGRGIKLALALADDISFIGKGNIVEFFKKVSFNE